MARGHPRPELPAVFRGAEAVREGALTPGELRGPRVRRLLQGVYAPRHVTDSHELRCAGAGLVIGPLGQITGPSMATVLGVPLRTTLDPVTVVLPDRQHQQAYKGIEFRRVSVDLDAGTRWRTTHLATPERMAFDLAARVDRPEAVARLDAVVRAGLVTREALQDWLTGRTDNNVRAVRAALMLVDPRSQSLQESRCRVVLLAAGLDVVPQHDITHRGQFVARADLAVVAARVAIEYDGLWHAARQQLERDRRRLNLLSEAGWTVVHLTSNSLRRPHEMVALVRAAVRRAA